ncbi:M1 family metallopeptidase [Christiangramia sabulilitoris]|uniref:Aminopeptidase N n=1 Tax=Christiangramia sabulilitoris TaxID=2583991 RepID=A0A550I327_9FLAO|nr:M1 family metallopeptidase [Christiangramia sabulilitoris]TRO65365.1 M1 family metallopeptidase [Christiangramia sabulilitoris]
MRKYLLFIFFLCSFLVTAQEKESSQTDIFDFKNIEAQIKIVPDSGKVSGIVNFTFEILVQQDSLFIDGRKMQFSNVLLNGQPVDFNSSADGIYIFSDFLPSDNNKLQLNYSAKPDSGMYFINWDYPEETGLMKQVWTQGQGKYTSTWLPSFDDMNEKLEFDLSFEFPDDYQLISNGKLVSNEKISDSTRLWQFDMEKPMSSYLVAMAAGKYDVQKTESRTGDQIFLYYQPQDSLKAEPTYRHTAEIFDFLEKEIGVAYPWQNYSQVPVQDFLYGGMENTGATIFSESFLTDSTGFKDRNYVNVNAHELAHQWFGNLVTESGNDHWLHEGFATYYALLTEKQIFGEDYYYWKLYETAEKLKEVSDSGKGESLLNPKASSLTFYQKGAWALHILREMIGDEAYREGITSYLNLYKFKNVTTDNFIAEMETASGTDLSQFKRDWLEQSAFKASQSLESLKKSTFITDYLNIAALRDSSLEIKYDLLDEALQFPVNDYIGQEVVHQLAGLQSVKAIELYKKAFDSNNIFVRQAIALTMDQIPPDLKGDFESLLEDDSYLTIEAALFKLWEQFPEERHKYLNQTRNLTGFYNKNIRMLWLTLNLVTPDFEPEYTRDLYEELAGYSAQWRPFQVRENAFSYLFQLGAFNEESLKSLISGTQHHTYSFRNYCRELLKELLKNPEYKQELIEVSEKMTKEETAFLRSKITG